MNADERAEARRACDVQHETAPEAYLADLLWKALDALEAAERERDAAVRMANHIADGDKLLYRQRDDARAAEKDMRARLAEAERERDDARSLYSQRKAIDDAAQPEAVRLIEGIEADIHNAVEERDTARRWAARWKEAAHAFRADLNEKESAHARRTETLLVDSMPCLMHELKVTRARLAEVERERDEARGRMETRRLALDLACEQRDTARAQVETLAEALFRIACGTSNYDREIAKTAIKAAGVET